MLEVALHAETLVGWTLALARVAGFIVVSPLLRELLPPTGRYLFAVGVGWFLAEPVPSTTSAVEIGVLTAANVATGAVLGLITGIIFYMFAVGGGVLDMLSGLAGSAVLDPTTGAQATAFSRLFNLGAMALFVAVGGLASVVWGLHRSLLAVPLDAIPVWDDGLARGAVELTSMMMLAGAEIVLPAVSALFLVEIALGLASRFSPQTNVFLLGLPAKQLLAFLTVGLCVLLFPEAVDGVRSVFHETADGVSTLLADE